MSLTCHVWKPCPARIRTGRSQRTKKQYRRPGWSWRKIGLKTWKEKQFGRYVKRGAKFGTFYIEKPLACTFRKTLSTQVLPFCLVYLVFYQWIHFFQWFFFETLSPAVQNFSVGQQTKNQTCNSKNLRAEVFGDDGDIWDICNLSFRIPVSFW